VCIKLVVFITFITNLLVFECADVGLKDVNRQTDGQKGTQTDRQTKHIPIHIHEHKYKDVVCRNTNISYTNYYKR
jgi:hypothetical protein